MALDHGTAGTTYDADSKNRTLPTWKGDHRACNGHRDGICHAKNGWMNAGDTKDAKVVAIIIERSIEPRARVQFEYGKDTMEPANLPQHKGWLPAAEAKDVKPSAEVLALLFASRLREIEQTNEHTHVPYSEAQKQIAEFKAAFAKNNSLEPEKPARKAG